METKRNAYTSPLKNGLVFSLAIAGAIVLAPPILAQDWVSLSTGTTHLLQDIAIVEGKWGWAVGRFGTIVHTSDAGASWVTQTSGTTSVLHSVSFVDSVTGWAVGEGNTVLHTTDGGVSWIPQTGVLGQVYTCHFLDRMTGWVAGTTGRIYHTTNGGASWTLQHSQTNQLLFEMYFQDESTIYIAGQTGLPFPREPFMLLTTNGGDSWSEQTTGAENGLQSVFFTDRSNGRGVGWFGEMIHTTNGGATWLPQESGRTDEILFSLFFNTSASGWIVGGESGCEVFNCDSLQGEESLILRTTNSGTTWEMFPNTVSSQHLVKVYFSSPDTGWIVGGGGTVLRTTNGIAGSSLPPDAVVLISPSHGITIPDPSLNFFWQEAEPQVDQYWFDLSTDSLFTNAQTDSTMTDTSVAVSGLLDNSTYYWRVRAHNASGWGPFSSPSMFLVQTQGGENLARIDVGGSGYADGQGKTYGADQSYVAGQFGYAGGSSRQTTSSILETEDDPLYQSWRTGSFSYKFDFGNGTYAVTLCFTEPSFRAAGRRVFDIIAEGEVVLDNYDIFVASGGLCIAQDESFVVDVLDGQMNLEFVSAAGSARPVLSAVTIDDAVARHVVQPHMVGVIPEQTELFQNYPNPFNPATQIRYGLKEPAWVTLTVYDMLGQKVAVLVDQWQQAGGSEVIWDGRNATGAMVSSGLYFYSIRAGEFISMKRMILMK